MLTLRDPVFPEPVYHLAICLRMRETLPHVIRGLLSGDIFLSVNVG